MSNSHRRKERKKKKEGQRLSPRRLLLTFVSVLSSFLRSPIKKLDDQSSGDNKSLSVTKTTTLCKEDDDEDMNDISRSSSSSLAKDLSLTRV